MADGPRYESSLIAHPISIFVGIWTFVFFLYGLRLSDQLVYDVDDFSYLYACLIGSFLVGYWYVSALVAGIARGKSSKPTSRSFQTAKAITHDDYLMWRRALNLFKVWALLTIVEIIVSAGVPIVWLLTGSAKSYRDFGIQSLHGFLISILLACSTVSFYLFLGTKKGKYLALPLFSLSWFVVSITRGFLIGLLLQLLCLSLVMKRPTFAQVMKIIAGFVVLVIFFGVIGDLRSGGGDLIRALGQPTDRYPDWLPTGFLWAYIYLATPLNNLFNTIRLNPSIDAYSLVGTTAQLFPTFIRTLLFSEASLTQGDLVDANLNVSTGFLGSYVDMGLLGIALFSGLLGASACVFWTFRRDRFWLFAYSFLAQALFLSIFYNLVLDLPCLFQLFWFWYLLRPPRPPAPILRPETAAS
jgi:oligosaccharide repeat unit polymerase